MYAVVLLPGWVPYIGPPTDCLKIIDVSIDWFHEISRGRTRQPILYSGAAVIYTVASVGFLEVRCVVASLDFALF